MSNSQKPYQRDLFHELSRRLKDREYYGRLVESAIGSHLLNASLKGKFELFYWRADNMEVDFILRRGKTLVAIEVKGGQRRERLPGLIAFQQKFKPKRSLLVGAEGISIETFLSKPAEYWLN